MDTKPPNGNSCRAACAGRRGGLLRDVGVEEKFQNDVEVAAHAVGRGGVGCGRGPAAECTNRTQRYDRSTLLFVMAP